MKQVADFHVNEMHKCVLRHVGLNCIPVEIHWFEVYMPVCLSEKN
jgi:hypothetical protein